VAEPGRPSTGAPRAADARRATDAPVDAVPAPLPRSWAEIRWRQFRNAPRPIVRAVLSSLIIALALAAGYVAYDLALSRGARLPGGDLRLLALTAYLVAVLLAGTVITYLIVPQPAGSRTVRRRSVWSAALGFFAAVPIAWLVMVVALQLIRPMFG
jgi:hypothetical protein